MALPNREDLYKDVTKMEVVSATYQFKIQYSKICDIRFGNSIASPIFNVNGHDCKIKFLPQGYEGSNWGKAIGVILAMQCRSEDVTASFTVGLLDVDGRPSSRTYKRIRMTTFKEGCWDNAGIPYFMEKSDLQTHFVKDDCFTLVCTVTIPDKSYKEVPKWFHYGVMPFNIDNQFKQLMDRSETADVRFEVEGKIFPAHRLVLAARSQVFDSQLFGSKEESNLEIIFIKDMRPEVFKAVLHFIYTDSLPDISKEKIPLVAMIQDLLFAAHRFALNGLKMLCEDTLLNNISVKAVPSILALAEEFCIDDLKNVCLLFVCDPVNHARLSVTNDYVQLMHHNPSLFKEIGDRVRSRTHF